jgi:predicted  nucleic acid-binding Zn-ribbon protein
MLPKPVVNNNGTFDGTVLGAVVLLEADAEYQNLVNSLEATAAGYATKLADMQTAIQEGLQLRDTQLYCLDDIDNIQKKIRNGQTLTDEDKNKLQDYTQQLPVIQSEYQAAIKSIDPVLTTTQNQPAALQQGANEFITELGSVIQGLIANSHNQIA